MSVTPATSDGERVEFEGEQRERERIESVTEVREGIGGPQSREAARPPSNGQVIPRPAIVREGATSEETRAVPVA